MSSVRADCQDGGIGIVIRCSLANKRMRIEGMLTKLPGRMSWYQQLSTPTVKKRKFAIGVEK
jgi:hypothetical protein